MAQPPSAVSGGSHSRGRLCYKSWAVLAAMLALTGWALASPAVADSGRSESTTSAVQAASYSTGQSGGRLKWLPSQPESAQGDTAVTATGYTRPVVATRPVRMAQNQPPKPASGSLSDPFGDKKDAQMPAEPTLQDSLPGLNPDEPAALEKSNVAPGGLTPLNSSKPAKTDSKMPSFDREFASRQNEVKETCPSPKDLKPLTELTTNITPSEGELPHDCPLGNATFQTRAFAPITYTWTASGLCHKPLYFEDVQLERYGHMAGPWVQPLASAAHFFLTFPILPYKMGLEPPNECMYSLGYYRPGNCAPYLFDPIPLSVRGALFEGGAWVGGVYAFP